VTPATRPSYPEQPSRCGSQEVWRRLRSRPASRIAYPTISRCSTASR
jgi:hypothetical protein